MKDGRLQCKDITTAAFLAAMAATAHEHGQSMSWDVAKALGIPDRLACAKAGKLIRAGVIDGCECGCRGDWVRL